MTGLGFEYAKDPKDVNIGIPSISGTGNWTKRNDYWYYDVQIENGSYHSWFVRITPELLFSKMRKGWSTFAGLQGDLLWGRAKGKREFITYVQSPIDTVYSSIDGWGSLRQYSINMVCGVDRLFLIKKRRFSAGIIMNFIGASYSKSYGFSSSTNSNTYLIAETKVTRPWSFDIRNPFNGSVALQLKYWF